MLQLGNDKKEAALAIAKMARESVEVKAPVNARDEARKVAARKFLDALKSDSTEALLSAMDELSEISGSESEEMESE